MSSQKGSLYIDIIIGILVISFVMLGSVGTLRRVHKGLDKDRFDTVFKNAAREYMEEMKKLSYEELKISDHVHSEWLDDVVLYYGVDYFPPITKRVNNRDITFYTLIKEVRDGSNIHYGVNYLQSLEPGSTSTGLKAIHVSILSRYNNQEKTYELTSLVRDPNQTVSNGKIIGTVLDQYGDIPFYVQVRVVEQPAYRAEVDNYTGEYSLNIPEGKWRFKAERSGYFSSYTDEIDIVPSPPNPPLVLNFTLKEKNFVHVKAYMYRNDRILFTQVGRYNGVNYIELYNPLLIDVPIADVTISIDKGTQPGIDPLPLQGGAISDIPSYGFYLIADAAGPVRGKTPDALTTPSNIFALGDYGGVKLEWNTKTDALGWTSSFFPSSYPATGYYESQPIELIGGFRGGPNDFELTRAVSTGTYTRVFPGDPHLYPPAYNMDDNTKDFAYNESVDLSSVTPNNSLDISTMVVSGTPSEGYYWFEDGLSKYENNTHDTEWFNGFKTETYEMHVPTGTHKFHMFGGHMHTMDASNTAIATMTALIQEVPDDSYNFLLSSNTYPAWHPHPDRTFPPALIANDPVTTPWVMFNLSVNIRGGDAMKWNIPEIPVMVSNVENTVYTASYYRYPVKEDVSLTAIFNSGPNALPWLGPPETFSNYIPSGCCWDGIEYTSPGYCVVQGSVTNTIGSGEPVKDVRLSAFNSILGIKLTESRTESDGSFKMDIALDKNIDIVVELDSGMTLVSPLSGKYSVSTYGLKFGDVIPNKDFQIQTDAFGSISGQVVSNSDPIREGLIITVSSFSFIGATPPDLSPAFRGSGLWLRSGFSNEEGAYSIEVPASNNPYYVTSWYGGVKKEIILGSVAPNSNNTAVLSWP